MFHGSQPVGALGVGTCDTPPVSVISSQFTEIFNWLDELDLRATNLDDRLSTVLRGLPIDDKKPLETLTAAPTCQLHEALMLVTQRIRKTAQRLSTVHDRVVL